MDSPLLGKDVTDESSSYDSNEARENFQWKQALSLQRKVYCSEVKSLFEAVRDQKAEDIESGISEMSKLLKTTEWFEPLQLPFLWMLHEAAVEHQHMKSVEILKRVCDNFKDLEDLNNQEELEVH